VFFDWIHLTIQPLSTSRLLNTVTDIKWPQIVTFEVQTTQGNPLQSILPQYQGSARPKLRNHTAHARSLSGRRTRNHRQGHGCSPPTVRSAQEIPTLTAQRKPRCVITVTVSSPVPAKPQHCHASACLWLANGISHFQPPYLLHGAESFLRS